ncbi:glutamic-type intramembrane protease PrsW [Caldalkalibacillus mannanilyticus]|uniref:glutamic-type intramembrane protease PrsW n=1 Tax=Caldalkalibacillus mannanilyticus TaxID=1418 RepID=UPI00046ADEB0|nr:glutamic-type intramembrane protease PrsW [Caldalkalibacillus mannanilyticus]
MINIIMAAIAPGIALLSFFYLKKKYDHGPIMMVIRVFLFGVLLVFPTMVLQYTLKEGLELTPIAQSFFIAAMLEEFLKWFVLFFIAIPNVEMEERYDGIIYSTAVSLGFATLENMMYLWFYGVQEALMRALLPVSSHALFGVIMGYYIGKAMFAEQRMKKKWLLYSLFIPIFLHGIYNYLLVIGSGRWLWLMIPFMLTLWWYGLNKVRKAAHDQHASSTYSPF